MALSRRPRGRSAWAEQEPTWREATPARIDAAVRAAAARPSGGWFALAASAQVRTDRAFGRTVAGREIVAWRGPEGRVHAGPGACPHLGAPLCTAPVHEGRLVCRWHGLALGPQGRPGWQVLPVHDDGVLIWIRLDDLADGAVSMRPHLGPRPPVAASVVTVATVVGRCTPDDVLANRLDPWHGVWLHPYSFARLRVLDHGPELVRAEVTYSIAGRIGIPVIAEFTCPDPRSVTMEIVEGEGTGSVVETHATPLVDGPDGMPRTAVIEAVLVHSDRPGFSRAVRAAPVLRPALRYAARRLWRDDLAYAERRYTLRTAART
ncbi:MAG: Rieske (2Fe-2S) protein [Pseudonocardia sp.]|nr:Rieske (2Fe-2S) protein [Pseudonocardia sp.]